MRKTINAKEFAKRYSDEFGVPLNEAEVICNRVRLLGSHLLYVEGRDISLHRFGALRHKKTAPKRFKHPKSGKMIIRESKDMIKFKATKNPLEMDKPPWEQ